MNNTTAPLTPADLAQHPTVTALVELQKRHGMSDAAFLKTAHIDYSPSTWSRIKKGDYTGALDKVLRQLQTALAKCGQVPAFSSDGFVTFRHVEEALAAVKIARLTEDPIRLVFFIAPTGGGKTAFAKHLAAQFPSTAVVEAAPSWRGSYLATLSDIATQLGIPGEFRAVRTAERAIISTLATGDLRTLVIDEGNYFSQDGLNFLKLILNRTKCSLVLCTLPPDFNRMLRDSAHEANQLVRRAVFITRVPTVRAEDVEAMQLALRPEVSLGDSAAKLAEAANRFGRYDFVRRVLVEAEPNDPGDIEKAIGRVQQMINTKPLEK
jgi:DNA transposition AAA+ family ATPase